MTVAVVDYALVIEVDRQLLASAVTNLLHNAFKFTRPNGHVTVTTSATNERVRIEIEDQCGGLPPGKAEELFLPFEQRGHDRQGLGLGLTISRRAITANDGTLSVRDLPGRGCVFTVDLPRGSSRSRRRVSERVSGAGLTPYSPTRRDHHSSAQARSRRERNTRGCNRTSAGR